MRAVLIAATLAVGLNSTLIPIAAAQNAAATYPSRPVRWIVPFAPGASNDITARLLAQKMSDSMGQQFVVDNRPGSGGSLGAKIVVDAAPDGYTVLHANPGPSINNVLLRTKPPYQMSDLAPVMFIGYSPLIIVAAPGFAPSVAADRHLILSSDQAKVNGVWTATGYKTLLRSGDELPLLGGTPGQTVKYGTIVDALGHPVGRAYRASLVQWASTSTWSSTSTITTSTIILVLLELIN